VLLETYGKTADIKSLEANLKKINGVAVKKMMF